MKIRIFPSFARGRVSAPSSKSMAHRWLLCAALAQGESRICGVSDCEDVQATIDCLRALGARCGVEKNDVTIQGVDFCNVPGATLPCRESGSTMRFFLPLCLLSGNTMILVGAPSLLRRPMTVYADLCREHDLGFEQTEQGITVKGPLTAGEYTLPGNISSQFISGMLFALTQVEGESILHILPPFESRSYVLLTLQTLAAFGADVAWIDDLTLCIRGGKPMRAQNITVEGDYSGAAFLSAFNLLGGEIEVDGLDPASLQGDRVYLTHFESLKQGVATISLADCPDLGPILFAMAAKGQGAHFTDTRRLIIKESNRAEAMAKELRKFGTNVEVLENEVIITPTDFHAPTEPLCGHNDHRIVMSLAVLATATGGVIEGAGAVAKSFPDFFERIRALGIQTEIITP
ncbi:MAG: 3-phosphoshikimate 1-carboxyvinyltransferase [Ruminococcaceae bacterium]|nr:3-phosphoshikimate 1-carboxyvinyltransferase [Oscillospiraceae bacterium]